MENVFAFVQEPKPLDGLRNSHAYQIMEKLNDGGIFSTGTDDGWDGWKHKDDKGNYITKPGYNRWDNDYLLFMELDHPEAYITGRYKLMGWIFDFSPFMKRYLVKTEDGYREQCAPSKEFIVECAIFPESIIGIYDLPLSESQV